MARLLVHHHLGDFGGGKRIDEEGGFIRVPLDDVDLLALQFGDHGLDARSPHADASADGIDAAVVGDHGHLGAAAGITGHGADFDDAVVDLGHFLGEQLGHEAAVGAGQHDLRAFGLAADVIDVRADTIADVEHFARDGLVAADNALAAAQIDDDVAVFDALDDAVDDFADAILVLFVLTLTLGLADLSGDDLTGHLGLDAAQLEGRQLFFVGLADKGVLVGLQRVRQGHQRVGVHRFFEIVADRILDHGDHPLGVHLAGGQVDLDADVMLGAVAAAGGLLHGLLDGLDDHLLFDRLFARDGVGDLQKFEAVGGNAGGHGTSPLRCRRCCRCCRYRCGPPGRPRRVSSARR